MKGEEEHVKNNIVLRKDLNMKVVDFAALLGVDDMAVSRRKSGDEDELAGSTGYAHS